MPVIGYTVWSAEFGPGTDAEVASCLALWSEAVLRRDGSATDLAGLEAQLIRIQEQFERADRLLLVARDGEGIAGFCLGFPEPAEAGSHLVLIAAAPRAQGRGVASGLLTEFAALRAAAGDAWLDLRVLEDNHAARRLYERLGWQPDGELDPHEVTGKLFQWYKLALTN